MFARVQQQILDEAADVAVVNPIEDDDIYMLDEESEPDLSGTATEEVVELLEG